MNRTIALYIIFFCVGAITSLFVDALIESTFDGVQTHEISEKFTIEERVTALESRDVVNAERFRLLEMTIESVLATLDRVVKNISNKEFIPL